MPEITVELSEEDHALVQEYDLDPSDLLSKQLNTERARIRRENPTPAVQDKLLEKIVALIEATRKPEATSRLGAFSDGVERAPVSVSGVRRDDETVEFRLSVTLNTLPSAEVGDTLRSSSPFLQELRENLEPAFEEVPPVTFTRSNRSPPEYDGDKNEVQFTATVTV